MSIRICCRSSGTTTRCPAVRPHSPWCPAPSAGHRAWGRGGRPRGNRPVTDRALLVLGEHGLGVAGVRGEGLAEFGAVEHGQAGALAVRGREVGGVPEQGHPHSRPRRSAPWQWRNSHSREAEDLGLPMYLSPAGCEGRGNSGDGVGAQIRTVQVGDIEVLAGEVQGVAAVPGTESQYGAGPGLTEHRGGVDGRRGGLLAVRGGVGAGGALPVPLLGLGRLLRVRRVLRPLVRVRRQPERAGAAAGQWLRGTCVIPALPARQTRAPVSARLSVSKEARIVITRPAGEPSARLEGGAAAPRRKRTFRQSTFR